MCLQVKADPWPRWEVRRACEDLGGDCWRVAGTVPRLRLAGRPAAAGTPCSGMQLPTGCLAVPPSVQQAASALNVGVTTLKKVGGG